MKVLLIILVFFVAGCATQPLKSDPQTAPISWVPEAEINRAPAQNQTEQEIKDFYLSSVQRAEVWTAPQMNNFDMVKSDSSDASGPSYAVNETVNCTLDKDFTKAKKKTSGKTTKFWCRREGDIKPVKIKYFSSKPEDNKEVFATAVTTRLFRALGFMANRTYSVSVDCPNCTENPWDSGNKKPRTSPFSPALIEFKPAGKNIDGIKEGWVWKDLDLIDPSLPADQQAQMKLHRGALKVLAAFVQHSDNKPEQQSLICLEPVAKVNGKAFCARPLMYVSDVGATWGGGGVFTTGSAKMSFNHFVDICMWEDGGKGLAKLRSSYSGSLGNDRLSTISEESRLFLAQLMQEFSSQPGRVREMFEVAQLDRMYSASKEKVSVDHWVAAFNIKVNELTKRTCYKEIRKKLKAAVSQGLPFEVGLVH